MFNVEIETWAEKNKPSSRGTVKSTGIDRQKNQIQYSCKFSTFAT
jgi:hypothetical protein